MEEKQDITQRLSPWIIPVLALLVIFQSYLIITQPKMTASKVGVSQLPEVEEVEESTAGLIFSPVGVSVKKGQTGTIDLILVPQKSLSLDGADIVLSFDPNILQITQVSTPKLFSIVSQKKDDEKGGRVFVTFLEEKQGGVSLTQQAILLSLTVKGNAVGEGTISIVTADYGASTVITEAGTSKKLVFDKGSAQVVVY